MKIIVGLGNPGLKYELTRHNVGFLAIDRLIDRWKASSSPKKHHGDIYSSTFLDEKILLVKPQTFMNLSGKCVSSLFKFYLTDPKDLIVIHDDLDLKEFAIRLKTGGGTGGHNGLKSIDESLGKDRNGYHRVRIGIGHPARSDRWSCIAPGDYVVMQYMQEELNQLDPLLDQVAESVEMIIQGQIKIAMNRFHSS